MLRLFRIWLINQKMSLIKRLTYPANSFLLLVGATLQIAVSYVFIEVIYMNVDSFGGWSRFQSILVVSIFNLIDGLSWASTGRLQAFINGVKNGQLDAKLVMPVDIQYLLSVSAGDFEDWVRVLSSLGVFSYAISLSGMSSAEVLLHLPLFLVAFICAYLIYYSIFLLMRSSIYFTINQDLSWLFGFLIDRISSYPTDIYGRVVRTVLVTVLPLTFIATVPAKVFLYYDWRSLLWSILATIVSLYVSRRFFHYALRHYESASN